MESLQNVAKIRRRHRKQTNCSTNTTKNKLLNFLKKKQNVLGMWMAPLDKKLKKSQTKNFALFQNFFFRSQCLEWTYGKEMRCIWHWHGRWSKGNNNLVKWEKKVGCIFFKKAILSAWCINIRQSFQCWYICARLFAYNFLYDIHLLLWNRIFFLKISKKFFYLNFINV